MSKMDSKTLNAFLNPVRKEHLRFVLSDAFVGEDGKPLEWMLRQLSAAESFELAKMNSGATAGELIGMTIAQSLVVPDLRDKDFLDALSKREGHPIMKPFDALKALLTDPEYGKLASIYLKYAETSGFSEKVEEAKN